MVFHRAVDALCAWTTGPQYLLRSAISKSNIPLSLSIVGLPREPVNDIAVDKLVEAWQNRSDAWSKETVTRVSRILERVRGQDPERAKGACHCEAGLMASLLVYAKVEDLPENAQSSEPEILVSALHKLLGQESLLHLCHPILTPGLGL